MRLLFVCTGNICRSPLAERLATTWAEQSLGAGAAAVLVRSAGLQALDGRSMDQRSAAALVELGGDPGGFQAQTFASRMADEADLVLTMTRRQRRLLLSQAPRALRRTFTLPEARDLLLQADIRGVAELPFQVRARELAIRLNDVRAWRPSQPTDDVQDPIGRAATVHREVGHRISRKLKPLAELLFADEEPGTAWPADQPANATRVTPSLRYLPPPR